MADLPPDWRSARFDSPGRDPVELEWTKTWPDELDLEDYVAIDNGVRIGRVYRLTGAPEWNPDRWFWGGSWPRGDGRAPSRREAMLALEEAYQRFRATREIKE